MGTNIGQTYPAHAGKPLQLFVLKCGNPAASFGPKNNLEARWSSSLLNWASEILLLVPFCGE
eukprot:11295537-Karenia_brevis.AAC.1